VPPGLNPYLSESSSDRLICVCREAGLLMRRRIPAHTIGTARLVGPDSRRSGVALTVTAPVSDGEGLSVRDTQEVLELNMHLRRFQQPSLTLVVTPVSSSGVQVQAVGSPR
jgi:hypothetical protein